MSVMPDGDKEFRFYCPSPTQSHSSNEYKIDAVKSEDGGEYQCAVNVKFCGAVNSNPLTINSKDSFCVCSSANV